MIDALLSRASTRFIFVVGKGGAGKTTTAGATALALADRGEATHLISTDPAHSIGDLFGQDLAASTPIVSLCSKQLQLEEFAARPYADEFFRELRGPLSELIERGTYLDAKDAALFLDLSIPGIDEVMSALRLVEVNGSGAQRVVVDTAPTGHALRLLDSPAILATWIAAGNAMLEKAGAVATALVGRPVPMQAEQLFTEWQAAIQAFNEQVLRNASAIVVTRPGRVVSAETDRLTRALHERGVRVAAVLSNTGPEETADFFVDHVPDARGCVALRAWRDHVHETPNQLARSHAVHRHTHTDSHLHNVNRWLRQLPARMVWVGGKGGVGKSTCAAAIACTQAQERKVCVVSTDPAGSLSEVLGKPVGASAVQIDTNLFARQIDAVAEFQRMRAQYRDAVDRVFEQLGLDQAAQLDRRVVESLWDFAPPGIDEIISLLEIVEHAGEFDALVIDSAPTGHFLRLIEMPEIALEWVHALLRLLVKYAAAASLDALARDLLAFAKRLKQLKFDLSTPDRTAVLIVTMAEPMVHAETARLSSTLERAGIPVAAMILNRADDGERVATASRTRWIRAPNLPEEAVGPAALCSFVAQWSFIGE